MTSLSSSQSKPPTGPLVVGGNKPRNNLASTHLSAAVYRPPAPPRPPTPPNAPASLLTGFQAPHEHNYPSIHNPSIVKTTTTYFHHHHESHHSNPRWQIGKRHCLGHRLDILCIVASARCHLSTASSVGRRRNARNGLRRTIPICPKGFTPLTPSKPQPPPSPSTPSSAPQRTPPKKPPKPPKRNKSTPPPSPPPASSSSASSATSANT